MSLENWPGRHLNRCRGSHSAQDYDFLRENGAMAIFGPGTVIPVAAQKVIEDIYKSLGYEEVTE